MRIAGFVVALLLAFGVGAGLGAAVGPIDTGGDDDPPASSTTSTTSPSSPTSPTHGGDHG